MREVTLAEVRAKLADSNVAVVNVLVPDYYRMARIPGSVNLPYDDIKQRVHELYPARDHEIVTYCGSHT